MPNQFAISGTLELQRSSVVLIRGTSTSAPNQSDTDGKFGGGSIKCSNSATLIPSGNCSVAGGACVWVFLKNLDATQDAKVEDGSAHPIGFVRAGKSWGPCLVDFIPKVKAAITDETPTIAATVVQE